MQSNYHETVMTQEVVDGLHIKSNGKYIDATLGSGGHSLAILKTGGKVLGIEADPAMLEVAAKRLEAEFENKDRYRLVHGNFVNIGQIAKENGWDEAGGVIFDLGVTNLHLTGEERGFSFSDADSKLDMRLDPGIQSVTGADLLNALREDQLVELFEAVLEPGPARWITGRVLFSRAKKPISTVGDLLEISRGLKTKKHRINEATLPFLAVRIAVNSELDNLKKALPSAFEILGSKGRLVVISFHSKEDGIVKDFFKEKKDMDEAETLTIKPVSVGEGELIENKRSRSARMRILEKI